MKDGAPKPPLGERILSGLAGLVCRRAGTVSVVTLGITAAAMAVVVLKGRVSKNLTETLPRDSRQANLFRETEKHFITDALLIAFEADSADDIEAVKPYVERLAERLLAREDLVRSAEYKRSSRLEELGRTLAEERGYLFLDEEDMAGISRKLSPEAIRRQMRENRERLEAAGVEYFRKRIAPDPLDLFEVIQRRRERARVSLTVKPDQDYLVSPDGRFLLVVVQATGSPNDLGFVRRFMLAVESDERTTWEELVSAEPARWEPLRRRVRIGHTGGYAVAINDDRTLGRDLRTTFLTSLVGVLLVFAIVFGRVGTVFYIGLPLVSSIIWTLAFAFLVFGRISIVSGGFGAILAGLSIDYAIHIYNRYVSRRAEGVSVERAVMEAITHSGGGIFFGSVTSAMAFLGVGLTRFVGLSEFGLLAGIGVLFGMSAMLVMQPALLVARDRWIRKEPARLARVYGFRLPKVAGFVQRAPRRVFIAFAALAAASAVYVYMTMDVYFFDSSFRNLRAESPIPGLNERIQEKFDTKVAGILALSRARTEEGVLEKALLVKKASEELMRGKTVARERLSAGPGRRHIALRVRGCKAALRSAQVALKGKGDEAERFDYPLFDLEKGEGLARDWPVSGRWRWLGGVELRPGSVITWRRPAEGDFRAVLSVYFLGMPGEVAVGLADPETGEGQFLAAGAKDYPGGFIRSDQLRLVFERVGDVLTFNIAEGTLTGIDSIAGLVPPPSRQRASAEFVASIDPDEVEREVSLAARDHRLSPRAFGEFFRQLRAVVGRAGKPKILTLEELEATEFRPVVRRYHAVKPTSPASAGPGESEHLIMTYLYPEQGELPGGWFHRVQVSMGGSGELTSGRLLTFEMREIVYYDFPRLTLLVFCLVMGSLLWSFRSLRWALASLIPVMFGTAFLVAIMLIIKHRLNFLNVLIFPVIIGIGIDDGIHIIHRFRRGDSIRHIITETGRALILTSITTMVGFGSLMVSSYKGLVSLGFVAMLGMFLCLVTSLLALTAFLAGFARKGREVEAASAVKEEGS